MACSQAINKWLQRNVRQQFNSIEIKFFWFLLISYFDVCYCQDSKCRKQKILLHSGNNLTRKNFTPRLSCNDLLQMKLFRTQQKMPFWKQKVTFPYCCQNLELVNIDLLEHWRKASFFFYSPQRHIPLIRLLNFV